MNFCSNEVLRLQILIQKNLEVTLKIMKKTSKIARKTWRNCGKILKFSQSGKEGTMWLS